MQWSEVKQQVFAFEGDIVVSAGAGSGKTATLVELYLRLLAGETSLGRPLEVEEIVAITFTEKAAIEMKERVRAGVLDRLAAGSEKRLWEQRRRDLAAANISTFHAFCSRILHENPAEAGVDPAFTLLDEAAAGAELREALDEVIEGELRARSDGIRLLLQHFPLSGKGHGKGLREHLISLHWQRSGSAAGETEQLRQTAEWRHKAQQKFTEEAGRLTLLIAEVQRILQGKPLQFHEPLKALPELYASSRLAPDSEETTAKIAAMQSCIAGVWGKEKPIRDGLAECLETMEICILELFCTPLALSLIELSGRVETAYQLRKDQRGVLDFDDLQRKTRDLLLRDVELHDACRRRFSVVMVDESQDTNPLQKGLVQLLTGPGQRLFMVGDPKQSIYLFRGADVAVFSQAQREIVGRSGQYLYFQESFRSRQGLIDFVNHFFSRVMQGGEFDFEVNYQLGDHLDPQRRDWDDIPCVELICGDDSDDAVRRRNSEAAAIAEKINRLVSGRDEVQVYDRKGATGGQGPSFTPRRPRFGDIAILFRRFTNLNVYERELRKRSIPYYVVKGRGFYRCQEVLDILNFLTWLEFGGELAALAGVFRSPLCGISDETLYLLAKLEGGIASWEKLFHPSPFTLHPSSLFERIDPFDRNRLSSFARLVSRLRPLRDRLTLAELLEEILTGTDFASTLLTTFQGRQKVANLRKLIEISRTFTESKGGSLRRFVNYMTDLVETEPTEAEALVSAEGEDVVRLMTIHQSKGLEFPVVFIPELGMMRPASNSLVISDESLGIGLRMALPGRSGRPTLAWREISALRKRKEGAELKRLLYVAMTRARDYLILSGEGKGDWRTWLTDYLDGEHAAFVKVSDASQFIDEAHKHAPSVESTSENTAGLSHEVITAALRRTLDYTPPLPTEMVFSPTALEDYRNCPRKYFYKAVLGLDEGLFAELLGSPFSQRVKRTRQGLSALDKGNLAHLLLERLDFTATSNLQRADCEKLISVFAANPAEDGVIDVIDAVTTFSASSLAKDLSPQQLFREYPFILNLKGKADYFIRGAMDLVAVTERRATVYDYKFLTLKDADLEGYRFQLRTYMLVLARAFPEKEISGALIFLRGGDIEHVTCNFSNFEKELLEIMEAIRERCGETEFPLMDSCDGSHCPFRQRCMADTSHKTRITNG
jgi:ATP-dependent exoDNAse (exonuclease V) beta subunit